MVDKEIQEKNDCLHKLLMSTQYLRGFVQSNDITNDSVSVNLFDEGRYPRTYPKQQIIEIERGIKNEHLNCWMSAMIQVICGTSLLDLLTSYEGSAEHPLTPILRLCQIRLSKKSKSPIPLRMIADVGKTLDKLMESNFKFHPWLGNETDTAEFYSRIISTYFDDLPSDKILSDLNMIHFDINYCLKCRGLTGASCREDQITMPPEERPFEI